jgi:RHS repeat-associated protein
MKPKHLILGLLLNLSVIACLAQNRLSVAAKLMRHDTALILFKRSEPQKFIVAAAIDKHKRTLYMLDRYGNAWDSLKMHAEQCDKIISGEIDPFKYCIKQQSQGIIYQNELIRQLREYGKLDTLSPLYNSAIHNFPEFKNTDSSRVMDHILTLQRQNMRDSLYAWGGDIADPQHLGDGMTYPHDDANMPGSVTSIGDKVFFVNPEKLSRVHFAILDKKKDVLYFSNRDSTTIGQIALTPENMSDFSKKDVFSLYLEIAEKARQKIDRQVLLYQKNKPAMKYAALKQQNDNSLSEILAKQRFVTKNQDYITNPDLKAFATMLKDAYSRVAVNRVWLNFLGIDDYTTPASWDSVGTRRYELTNQLGNVMAVISDKRLVDSANGSYKPDIKTAQDYYAFGAMMPGRSFNAEINYPFGFNGKRYDNEVMGIGNWQDYGMRMYDPRIGRFPSVDPMTSKYPMLTSYQFASNSPIAGIDLDGREFGAGYAIDYISEGVNKLGLTRTAGFISSYGHSLTIDPVYTSVNWVKKVANGQYGSAAQDFDVTGVSSAINFISNWNKSA